MIYFKGCEILILQLFLFSVGGNFFISLYLYYAKIQIKT